MEQEQIKCQYENCNILLSEGEYCYFHREEILEREEENEIERDPNEPEIEEDLCNQCGKVGCEECKEIDDGCEIIYCEPVCSKCDKEKDDCSCDEEDIDIDETSQTEDKEPEIED